MPTTSTIAPMTGRISGTLHKREFAQPVLVQHASTQSSLLGGTRAARYAPGKDIDALGPSDSSDHGSDMQGECSLQGKGDRAGELGSLVIDTDNGSDAFGTGERGSATGRDVPVGADITPDQVIKFEAALKVDKCLLVVHGSAQDQDKARSVLAQAEMTAAT